MFLGLDLGTSELKALLLDDQHQVRAVVRSPLSVQRPAPTWSEQFPADWWIALTQAMDRLQSSHADALAQVRAVGLSGQMHGAVLMGEQQQVLRPAILWNDGRSGAQCEQLEARWPALRQITGNLAMPGFTAPKLLWVQQHEPAVFSRTHHVLLPKDWLRWRLTGELATDMSDASGTLWLATGLREWSDELLQASGLQRRHMPRLCEGNEMTGWLKPEWCQRWGMPARVSVAAGAGDNAASAVGMGLVQPGQGFVSLGTSGVIFVCADGHRPNPAQGLHAFCHALPGRWHQMSVMLSAASAVSWAAQRLAFKDEASLLAAAATLSPSARVQAPLFFPYLSGERTPHNQPLATASWWGLTAAHDTADMAYAVAEGVALGLCDGLQALGESQRMLSSLSLVGGGARSAWWAQLLADALNLPLTLHDGAQEGAALGAARLAWLSTGASEQDVCLVPPVSQRFEPDEASSRSLRERYARFSDTSRGLMPWMVSASTRA